MKTLYADSKSGVRESGDDAYITDTMSETEFYDSLKSLTACEYIKCAAVSDEMYARIRGEYGIN